MLSQKFETLGVWDIRRWEVVNTVYFGALDALEAGITSDDVRSSSCGMCAAPRTYLWSGGKPGSEWVVLSLGPGLGGQIG